MRWEDANIHILSTAVQFASSVFEGMRCYSTSSGPAILFLQEHLRRLKDSCKIYRIELSYDVEELGAACFETIEANGLEHCYIRPMVLRGLGGMGMDGDGSPIDTYIPVWEWGAYLGDDAFETGVDVCTSSWSRPAANTFPGMAKAAGNYANAALIKLESRINGYAEAIALSPDGLVSEGSGQNVFVVRDGALYTPPINGSNLSGLTRAAVITLARQSKIEVHVQPVPREFLYIADEIFFTGTATEIMPIRSLDKITIGDGNPGPITKHLQKQFVGIVSGQLADNYGWLSYKENGAEDG